nr:MAG TPA: hypothetical protein [Bacteriophage sp.]
MRKRCVSADGEKRNAGHGERSDDFLHGHTAGRLGTADRRPSAHTDRSGGHEREQSAGGMRRV